MVEVGRDLWTSPCPVPLPKQGPLELHAQDHAQATFENLQGGRFHHLSWQPVPELGYPHSQKVFAYVQIELSMFLFVHTASSSVTIHTEKSPALVVLHPPFRYL